MEEKNEIKNKNKIIEEDDDFNEEISLSIFDKKNKIKYLNLNHFIFLN